MTINFELGWRCKGKESKKWADWNLTDSANMTRHAPNTIQYNKHCGAALTSINKVLACSETLEFEEQKANLIIHGLSFFTNSRRVW